MLYHSVRYQVKASWRKSIVDFSEVSSGQIFTTKNSLLLASTPDNIEVDPASWTAADNCENIDGTTTIE
jgi:hypothetical protein